MFRADRKDLPPEDFLSRVAESFQTGVYREGEYEVHIRKGWVVGSFYLGFPAPPVWVAAALLLPGEGKYTFAEEIPSEGGKPLPLTSFLLEGTLALDEARALGKAHPSSLVLFPGKAVSGPKALLPLLPLASLTALLPGFEAAAFLLGSDSFLLEKRGKVLLLRGAHG